MRNALVGLLLISSIASADGLELTPRTQARVSKEIGRDSKLLERYLLIQAGARRNPEKSAKLSEALNRWSETNSKESLETILMGQALPDSKGERAGAPMPRVAEQKVDYQRSFYSYKAQTVAGKKFFEQLASSDRKSERAMREEIGRILHVVETKTVPNLKPEERPMLAKSSYLCAELWLTKFVPWGEENQKRSLEYLEQTLQGKPPIFKSEGAKDIALDATLISGLVTILESDPKDLKTDMLDVLTGRSVPEQKSQRDLLLDGFKSE